MFTEGFSILQLALLALEWIIFHRFVLLWRREHCGWIFHRSFFFSGGEHSVAKITAVPCSSLVLPTRWNRHYRPLHFWAVCFSEVNFVTVHFSSWHWKSSARNHRRSLHFAGVRLFSSRFNSVGLFVRNPFSGWKMNAWVTRQAAGDMKKCRGEIELLALFSGGCFTAAIRIAK